MKKIILLSALCFALYACAGSDDVDAPYNQADFAQGGPDAPALNERTMTFMQPGNQFAGIESQRPRTQQEKNAMSQKWNTSRMQTHWQEYRGTMVRVEILLGDTDLREMRLRLMQNANGMDIDGDMRWTLDKVADFEMKRVCGRNADSYVIVYDRASFDVMRPTPYFDWAQEAGNASMREYGFRCIYVN
ncbi:MAG: hypothetical protein FWC61_04145 [Proteobacteria bacterium]|nr:hypothetical protein [Pseudomonadota bacterium]